MKKRISFLRKPEGFRLSLLVPVFFMAGHVYGNSDGGDIGSAKTALCRLKIGMQNEAKSGSPSIEKNEYRLSLSNNIPRVREFAFIQAYAKAHGIRVFLIGKSAGTFAYYAKWALMAQKGGNEFDKTRFDFDYLNKEFSNQSQTFGTEGTSERLSDDERAYAQWNLKMQKGGVGIDKSRLDYDYVNIFRSNSLLTLATDATPEKLMAFEDALRKEFPYVQGREKSGWKVFSLFGLIENADFWSIEGVLADSLGAIELTPGADSQTIVRDVFNFGDTESNSFLTNVLTGSVTVDQFHQNRNLGGNFYLGPNTRINPIYTEGVHYKLSKNGVEGIALIAEKIEQQLVNLDAPESYLNSTFLAIETRKLGFSSASPKSYLEKGTVGYFTSLPKLNESSGPQDFQIRTMGRYQISPNAKEGSDYVSDSDGDILVLDRNILKRIEKPKTLVFKDGAKPGIDYKINENGTVTILQTNFLVEAR